MFSPDTASMLARLPLSEGHNPLLPAPYDLMWSGVLAVAWVLALVALVDVFRLPATAGEKLGLALVILCLPVLGLVSYLLLRPRFKKQPYRSDAHSFSAAASSQSTTFPTS